MARKKTDARELVVAQLVEIFFEHGFDGTTLNIISQRTGLGRASIYHHFPGGKTEMARAVLEHSDRWCYEYVRNVALDASRPPKNRLAEVLKNWDEVHSRPEQLTPANTFVIGENAEVFAPQVQEHVHGQLHWVAELMIQCGLPPEVARRRSWEFRILWEGGLVCARVQGDMSIFRNLMKRMPAYLLAPPEVEGFLSDRVPALEPGAASYFDRFDNTKSGR